MNEAKKVNDSAGCPQCRTRMKLLQVKKYQGKLPLTLVGSGVLSCLFFVGALVGIPLILGGIYMASAQDIVKYCPNCGYHFKVLVPKPDSA